MTNDRANGTETNESRLGPEDPASRQDPPEGGSDPRKQDSRLNLYVGGVVAFLGYEILLVLGLASMLDFGSVGTTFFVVLLSVPGYFMLGYLSESLLPLCLLGVSLAKSKRIDRQ